MNNIHVACIQSVANYLREVLGYLILYIHMKFLIYPLDMKIRPTGILRIKRSNILFPLIWYAYLYYGVNKDNQNIKQELKYKQRK